MAVRATHLPMVKSAHAPVRVDSPARSVRPQLPTAALQSRVRMAVFARTPTASALAVARTDSTASSVRSRTPATPTHVSTVASAPSCPTINTPGKLTRMIKQGLNDSFDI